MADVARLSTTVYGRVQGVYFRYFVRNVARNLGLEGYVRNLASGDAVEIKAEGQKPQLDRLLDQDWSGYTGQFDSFSIRY